MLRRLYQEYFEPTPLTPTTGPLRPLKTDALVRNCSCREIHFVSRLLLYPRDFNESITFDTNQTKR